MNITPTLHKQCKPKEGQPVYTVSNNTAMASVEKTYSYKGVEYTFAETVPEDLVCPICQDLLDDTQQTPCGHLFCKECLRKTITSQGFQQVCPQNSLNIYSASLYPQLKNMFKCPICQTQHRSNAYNDSYNDRRVKNLRINCPNVPCTWTGCLHELDKHRKALTGCQYQEDACTMNCGARMLRKELPEHLQSRCPLRQYQCQFCKMQDTYRQIVSGHYKKCDAFLLKCPNNCGETIPQKDIKGHLLECPDQDVKCGYCDVGCLAIVARKDLEMHNAVQKDIHLSLAMGKVVEVCGAMSQLYTMFGKLEKRLQQLETRQGVHGAYPAVESSSVSQTQPKCAFLTFHCTWLENDELFPSMPWNVRMDNFEEKRLNGTRWESKPFYTHRIGYQCCLRIYAKAQRSPDSVSVYLVPMAGPNDDYLEWPFSGAFEVTLLNQLQDKHHNLQRFAVQFDRVQHLGKGMGFGEFISHTDLQKEPSINRQYLMDDCLYFNVKLCSKQL